MTKVQKSVSVGGGLCNIEVAADQRDEERIKEIIKKLGKDLLSLCEVRS